MQASKSVHLHVQSIIRCIGRKSQLSAASICLFFGFPGQFWFAALFDIVEDGANQSKGLFFLHSFHGECVFF